MQSQYRLKSRAAYNYVYRKGQSVSNRQMILVYVKSRQSLKAGFSVSKKVGNSVVRNRVKRLMKESFRLMIPEVEDRYNYIFVARPTMVGLGFAEVSAGIAELLKKAGKLKEVKS